MNSFQFSRFILDSLCQFVLDVFKMVHFFHVFVILQNTEIPNEINCWLGMYTLYMLNFLMLLHFCFLIKEALFSWKNFFEIFILGHWMMWNVQKFDWEKMSTCAQKIQASVSQELLKRSSWNWVCSFLDIIFIQTDSWIEILWRFEFSEKLLYPSSCRKV